MNRIHLPIFALILVSPAFAADTPANSNQPALAGGYSSTEIDSEVRTVAEFAVKTQSESTEGPLKLIKILKAERQVVAGLNYRLEIEVADGNMHLKARTVIWQKLDGSLALTSWEPLPWTLAGSERALLQSCNNRRPAADSGYEHGGRDQGGDCASFPAGILRTDGGSATVFR